MLETSKKEMTRTTKIKMIEILYISKYIYKN